MMRLISHSNYDYLIHKFQKFVELLQIVYQLNMKFSKVKLSKIIQLGGVLARLLVLLKTGLPLIENALKPLAKSLLIPLGLTAAASATDASIHKKMFGTCFTTLITSNEEMNAIKKAVKSLEDSNLIKKTLVKHLKMKEKNKKEDFLECY